MTRLPGLRDVRSTLQRGNTEIAIQLDRDKLAALGLDTRAVTTTLQEKVQGSIPTLFAERERKIDMMVRLDRAGLRTVTQLLAVNVNPGGNPPTPLSSIATLQRKEGPSEIRRIGNLRGAEVQATLGGLDLGRTHAQLELELADLKLPVGMVARIGGQKAESEASLRSLTMALLLAVFLVYVVMASQFENMVQPFVILLTMPLALVGVVFMLELTGIPISVVVFLGGIVLAGIVVNNAIIMIDQINQLRRDGKAKLLAIVEGAQIRLRPVLMTTITTVLGLLPLTGWIGGGEGLELRAPMAIVVITGLTVSTLLTLVIIPVVYSLSDRRA
jgi:HAE1 family hydrophobic/amphiphilic exporter-1